MIVTMTTPPAVFEDGPVSTAAEPSPRRGPRADRPRPRRSFTPAQKEAYVQGYELARQGGDGEGYLRREGLYSSLMSEWRRSRDAGLLAGKTPGQPVGRPSAEQAQIARLTRELEVTRRRLATTETALDIMGKARELFESISKSEPGAPDRPAAGPAAALTGIARATMDRAGAPARVVVPAASRAEEQQVLAARAAARPGAPARSRRTSSATWRTRTSTRPCIARSSSIRRPRRSTPPCWGAGSTCARPPRCTASCAATTKSETGAVKPDTHPGPARS